MNLEGTYQLGKNGVTAGVVNAINLNLKNHSRLRISVLKALTRDRTKLKEIADEIVSKVSYKSHYKIIGFTIILKKQSGKK